MLSTRQILTGLNIRSDSDEQMSKAQSWHTCDEDIRDFILALLELLRESLSDNWVGVYLHGSLAMGSYYRPKSDIDLLIVVKGQLPDSLAKAAAQAVALHSDKRPTTGDIEIGAITQDTAKQLPNPMPFEFHYSSMWHDDILNDRVTYDSAKTDVDLNACVMYVVKRGITLSGRPIAEVFGQPDWKVFKEAILDDFNWIVENENILETPFYGVLNICRVLQTCEENTEEPKSKDEGGEWALQNLPARFHPLIQQALDVYRSAQPIDEGQRRTGGVRWVSQQLLEFRDFAKAHRV